MILSRKEIEDVLAKAKAHGINVQGDYLEFNKFSPNFQILPNFKLHEFLTKNTKETYTLIDAKIMIMLQKLRTSFGHPIGVSSSYRSPSYNKSRGGATSSEHMKGNALDTYPINGDNSAWILHVKANKTTGGNGYYKTFVHIDTGRTRWWNG